MAARATFQKRARSVDVNYVFEIIDSTNPANPLTYRRTRNIDDTDFTSDRKCHTRHILLIPYLRADPNLDASTINAWQGAIWSGRRPLTSLASSKNYLKDIRKSRLVPRPSLSADELKVYNQKLIEADRDHPEPVHGPQTLLQSQTSSRCSGKALGSVAADEDVIMEDSSSSPEPENQIMQHGPGRWAFRRAFEPRQPIGTYLNDIVRDSPSPERRQAAQTLLEMHAADQARGASVNPAEMGAAGERQNRVKEVEVTAGPRGLKRKRSPA